jgi:hypothetical protein
VTVLNVYIGYDPREVVAFHVLAHSIVRQSSIPVSIVALKKSQLAKIYTRLQGPMESTEFSLTRFLVPFLSGYGGWSVYMDCDMLCRSMDFVDITKEMERQSDKAVLVCKHDYTPNARVKFLNQVQSVYPRKNWSSFMVFNNERCRALTPEYVNSALGLELHRFVWTEDRSIGELPLEWNWLVGEYRFKADAKIVHFTKGGPYFAEYRDCDYADEWRDEFNSMRFPMNGPLAR